jgi:hypothetical protein
MIPSRAIDPRAALGGFAIAFGAIVCACSPGPRTYASHDAGEDAAIDAEPPYPPPPYGYERGDTIPNLHFMGYRGGVGAFVELRLSDYYDPDGARGINAVLVTAGAEWCPLCNDEALALPSLYARYASRGVRFLSLLLERNGSLPATQATLDGWLEKYALAFDSAIDPLKTTVAKTDAQLPRTYFVDPRTMQIVRVEEGFHDTVPYVTDLDMVLKENGVPTGH